MFATFQYRGLYHLELHSTLTIEAWLKLNMRFMPDIWNYEMHAYLDKYILCWMLEMEWNLNILQLFFLEYFLSISSLRLRYFSLYVYLTRREDVDRKYYIFVRY